MKFLIYEIWIRETVCEADSAERALEDHDLPSFGDLGLNLSNWHAVPLDPMAELSQPGRAALPVATDEPNE